MKEYSNEEGVEEEGGREEGEEQAKEGIEQESK